MEYFIDYLLFFSKFVSVVVTIAIVIIAAVIIIMRTKSAHEGHIEIRNLNHKFEEMGLLMKSQVLGKKELKQAIKLLKSEHKEKEKQSDKTDDRNNIFVLNFKGDIKASEVESLREEITSILTVAKTSDEVVLVLESAGGTVHGYGLAASQLKRICDRGISLTVAVDKVAASGGYMMACVANKIVAAPFAIIGSVGVLAQLPNFHRLMKKYDIDYEQLSAGEYKRTLTLFGKNDDKDREKFQEELEDTHELFKEFIKDNRKQIDIEKIATGEHWYGKRALELQLVDELITSDDYLYTAATDANIYEITQIRKKAVSEKLFSLGMKLFDY
ncbi:MAG: protease SohB [Gammaproteobacteria bacterium]|nr:MAG: protease SohB [Gammaproteobacteria bacterium]